LLIVISYGADHCDERLLQKAQSFQSVKAFRKTAECGQFCPFLRQLLRSLPKPVYIQSPHNRLKVAKLFPDYIRVDTFIKIARRDKRFVLFAFGTAEHVSVIDKCCVQGSGGIFDEDSLPVVCMICANVDQPCEPECIPVADPTKTGTREDFQKLCVRAAKKLGAVTQPLSGSQVACWHLHPAARILVEKSIRDQQRLPFRNGQPTSAEQLASHALIE